MHLMLCNGLAFTLKSAPQVCVLFRVHAAEADVYLTQTLFCFYSDDVPYDVWNCIKCHFCYRGIHKECVLDTSLSHICSRCADVPAKKKLPLQEEQSTGRFAFSPLLRACMFFFFFVYFSFFSRWRGGVSIYQFLCPCKSLKQSTKSLADAKKETRAGMAPYKSRLLRKRMLAEHQSDNEDSDHFEQLHL